MGLDKEQSTLNWIVLQPISLFSEHPQIPLSIHPVDVLVHSVVVSSSTSSSCVWSLPRRPRIQSPKNLCFGTEQHFFFCLFLCSWPNSILCMRRPRRNLGSQTPQHIWYTSIALLVFIYTIKNTIDYPSLNIPFFKPSLYKHSVLRYSCLKMGSSWACKLEIRNWIRYTHALEGF